MHMHIRHPHMYNHVGVLLLLYYCLSHNSLDLQFNFEGNYDVVRFFKEIQNAGMYAILRIGPYICGEWNYGYMPMLYLDTIVCL